MINSQDIFLYDLILISRVRTLDVTKMLLLLELEVTRTFAHLFYFINKNCIKKFIHN